jgi:hypothetical protein
VVDTLYFGAAKPGGEVSAEEWQAFLETVVIPRFPDGLTWWRASGQWRPRSGEVRKEASIVLQIAHDDSRRDAAPLRDIAAAYKSRHRQEAVLRTRTKACVSLD